MSELFDIVVMTLALGFIFKDVFLPRMRQVIDATNYDPLAQYNKTRTGSRLSSRFSYLDNGFVLAIIITAPAIILHELGHKLLAISFGATAVFNAAYFWLGLGMVLKLLNFGFIFFVPAYVSIGGVGLTDAQFSAIAFAGPFVNLVLFAGARYMLKSKYLYKRYKKYAAVISMTARINLFLFVFNMLPIPGFDGWKVFTGLLSAFA
ncbi:MAG: hypothetical protein V1729_07150 [Candidatus Woesearchaeota archaeon]